MQVRTSTQEAIRAATAAAAPNVPLVLDDATARAIFGPLRVSQRKPITAVLKSLELQHEPCSIRFHPKSSFRAD